ncbi:MAG: fibronectin type III domain-containing protein [Desulfobacteraceae bacterium]|nr:fibronectin type III domain-containing protein [Desulfobacteraceae bacterium]
MKFILSFIFLLFNLATTVYAIDITLQWTPNNDPNLAGFRAFYREINHPYDYENPYWESIDSFCTIYDLDETKTYYFVVRAFDKNGSESVDSNEVLLMEGIAVNQLPTENISSNDSNDIGCFIATAAYGSLMEPHVKILRDFRDRFLFDNAAGRSLVRLYYNYSPPIADFIAEHDSLRAMVRISLLPFVGVSWIALKIGPLSTVALMLFFISCFLGLVWFRRRFKE